MKKHGPNTARKFNHDGYSCKNTVLIVTAMGKTEKTRSKWATMGGMSNKVLIVTARLQLSSVEYYNGVFYYNGFYYNGVRL